MPRYFLKRAHKKIVGIKSRNLRLFSLDYIQDLIRVGIVVPDQVRRHFEALFLTHHLLPIISFFLASFINNLNGITDARGCMPRFEL